MTERGLRTFRGYASKGCMLQQLLKAVDEHSPDASKLADALVPATESFVERYMDMVERVVGPSHAERMAKQIHDAICPGFQSTREMTYNAGDYKY